MSCNWNENNLNPLTSINWRASLVPAAAVIPAPIAYIKVVAVKKLVVGFLDLTPVRPSGVLTVASGIHLHGERICTSLCGCEILTFYFEEIRVFQAGVRLEYSAWNNKIGLWFYFVGFRAEVMINRDSWGHSYLTVRGEILGFVKDGLLRKHLPRMFSLIKNES